MHSIAEQWPAEYVGLLITKCVAIIGEPFIP